MSSDQERIERSLPNPGPVRRRRDKPRLAILPAGISAEEAAKLLQEWAAEHADKPDSDPGPTADKQE